ncbi:hypothetical protein ES706_02360 [subsurface metagenome]
MFGSDLKLDERGAVPWTILFMAVFFIFAFFLVYSIISVLFGLAVFRAFLTIIILGLVLGYLFKPLKTLTKETRKLVKKV